jgi:hypothetical protein
MSLPALHPLPPATRPATQAPPLLPRPCPEGSTGLCRNPVEGAAARPLPPIWLEWAGRALARLPAPQFRRAIDHALDELGDEWGIEL